MHKDELVAAVALRTGLSKAKARDAVIALFGSRSTPNGIIAAGLHAGEAVQIGDFGTFGTPRAVDRATGGSTYFHASRALRRRLEKSAP